MNDDNRTIDKMQDKTIGERLQFIGNTCLVHINNPIGSLHPDKGFIFPVNYGVLQGVTAPGGGTVRAYVLGVFDQKKFFQGRCIAAVERNDNSLHAIVVPSRVSYTDDQIRALIEFQERFHDYALRRNENK